MAASGAVDANFLQQGCRNQLPPCSLAVEDLSAYPGLANLLTDLKKHIDPSGMSIALAQPCAVKDDGSSFGEARKELEMHRVNWLKWEALHRLLREALLELGADPAPHDKQFLETLEQQLLVAELKRMLDLDSSLPNARPSVLGLQPGHLTEYLPAHQDLEHVHKHLPAKVEKLLKAKCLDVLGYYRPESGRHDGSVRQVLLRCLGLLKRFAREFRLGVQSELDQLNTLYLEIKCSAMLLKIRFEEVKILLDTYTPEVVNVHRIMRDKLQASLSQEELDLATSRDILSNYEILGPEFEELVKEYTQLQEIIQNRRWVLTKFSED
ncbi:hypothetical protein Chor_009658 [Crotalus horridus]